METPDFSPESFIGRYEMKSEKKRLYKLIEDNGNFTAFQKKIYKVILDIPRGEVRSYRWVASKAGSPRAYRAVGCALKKNPYTVILPCHRVIRSDGSIGEYSRGVAEKKRLLAEELN